MIRVEEIKGFSSSDARQKQLSSSRRQRTLEASPFEEFVKIFVADGKIPGSIIC